MKQERIPGERAGADVLSFASSTHALAFTPWPSILRLTRLPMRVKDTTLTRRRHTICWDQFS